MKTTSRQSTTSTTPSTLASTRTSADPKGKRGTSRAAAAAAVCLRITSGSGDGPGRRVRARRARVASAAAAVGVAVIVGPTDFPQRVPPRLSTIPALAVRRRPSGDFTGRRTPSTVQGPIAGGVRRTPSTARGRARTSTRV